MWGNVNLDGKHGVRRIYYTCGMRPDCRRGCGNLRGDQLEEYVLRLLEAIVGSDAAKERIRAAIRTQLKLQSENDPGRLNRTLEDIDRRIAAGQRNLFRAKPEEFEAFQGFLEELRQQRTQILEAQGQAVNRREASEIEKRALRAVDDIARILRSKNRRLVNELITEVFESITVHRQRIGRWNYLVRGRVIFRSSFGPLAHIRLERSIENLRKVPILRRLEVVRRRPNDRAPEFTNPNRAQGGATMEGKDEPKSPSVFTDRAIMLFANLAIDLVQQDTAAHPKQCLKKPTTRAKPRAVRR